MEGSGPISIIACKVIHLAMPPLRAMRELGKGRLELTLEAMRSSENYDWPGNARQFVHRMKRLVVLSLGPLATAADLSTEIGHADRTTSSVRPALSSGTSLKTAVEELERRMLHEALMDSKCNQVLAARKLRLSRQGLIKKLKRYGIVPRAGAT
jgi:two-component system response regulator AtoC